MGDFILCNVIYMYSVRVCISLCVLDYCSNNTYARFCLLEISSVSFLLCFTNSSQDKFIVFLKYFLRFDVAVPIH